MKYRILVLVCAFFLLGGCWKDDWQLLPDSNDYKSIVVKGFVVSRADQQPVANVKLAHRRCGVIFGDCTETGQGGVTDAKGHFEFGVNLYYWYNNYLVLEGIDSSYEAAGYVNDDYVYNLMTQGVALRFPSDQLYTNTFKIELIRK